MYLDALIALASTSGASDLHLEPGLPAAIRVRGQLRSVGELLTPFQASIERLNLHPDFKRIVQTTHGLVIVSGSTGSGKSSTLAALMEEVNRTERRHIVTIES